jgi:hypothetical protein
MLKFLGVAVLGLIVWGVLSVPEYDLMTPACKAEFDSIHSASERVRIDLATARAAYVSTGNGRAANENIDRLSKEQNQIEVRMSSFDQRCRRFGAL